MEIPYIEDFKLPYSYNIKPMKSYKPTSQKDPLKQQGDDVKILGNGNTILEEVDASFESGTNHYSYSYKVKFENGGKTNIYIEWDKNTKIDIGVFGSEGNKLDSPADNAPKKNSNGDNVQLCHVMYVKPGEEYLITLDIEKLENGTTDYTIDIKPCDNIPKYQNIGYNRDADIYNNELKSAAISSFDRRLNASEVRIEERDRLSGVGGKIDKENQTQKTPEAILMELDISAAMKSVNELDGASNGIEVVTKGKGNLTKYGDSIYTDNAGNIYIDYYGEMVPDKEYYGKEVTLEEIYLDLNSAFTEGIDYRYEPLWNEEQIQDVESRYPEEYIYLYYKGREIGPAVEGLLILSAGAGDYAKNVKPVNPSKPKANYSYVYKETREAGSKLANGKKHIHRNVKDVDAYDDIQNHLGDGIETNIHPKNGTIQKDSIYVKQPDGSYNSVRIGNHEMKNPNNQHYHLEKWDADGNFIRPDTSVKINNTRWK